MSRTAGGGARSRSRSGRAQSCGAASISVDSADPPQPGCRDGGGSGRRVQPDRGSFAAVKGGEVVALAAGRAARFEVVVFARRRDVEGDSAGEQRAGGG